MGRKHLFSLIEIAVAMAVAAIGVAAIMALLPIAVKTTSDSVGDTLAADAANSVIALLDRAAWTNFDAIRDLPTTKPIPFSDDDARSYSELQLDASDKNKGSYRTIPNTIEDGHFAFIFGLPNQKSDFAAEVLCWREHGDNVRISTIDTEDGNSKTILSSGIVVPETTGKRALVRVFIEITWPLSKPYNVGSVYPRQSRTFVREYLDPAYHKPVTK